MNERIQEFILQATETTDVYNPDTGITHYREFFDHEKFAELIVKECRDIISATRDQAIEDEWNVDEAMSTAMFDIEDHFGVE